MVRLMLDSSKLALATPAIEVSQRWAGLLRRTEAPATACRLVYMEGAYIAAIRTEGVSAVECAVAHTARPVQRWKCDRPGVTGLPFTWLSASAVSQLPVLPAQRPDGQPCWASGASDGHPTASRADAVGAEHCVPSALP